VVDGAVDAAAGATAAGDALAFGEIVACTEPTVARLPDFAAPHAVSPTARSMHIVPENGRCMLLERTEPFEVTPVPKCPGFG
jgi:hypothetical protein